VPENADLEHGYKINFIYNWYPLEIASLEYSEIDITANYADDDISEKIDKNLIIKEYSTPDGDNDISENITVVGGGTPLAINCKKR
jgi:hypothetical protein